MNRAPTDQGDKTLSVRSRLQSVVSEDLGIEGARRLRVKLQAYWMKILDTREEALGPIPDDVLPSDMPNRIPQGAFHDGIRLLDLVDELLDDYKERVKLKPSIFAKARRADRRLVWNAAVHSDPASLLIKGPGSGSTEELSSQDEGLESQESSRETRDQSIVVHSPKPPASPSTQDMTEDDADSLFGGYANDLLHQSEGESVLYGPEPRDETEGVEIPEESPPRKSNEVRQLLSEWLERAQAGIQMAVAETLVIIEHMPDAASNGLIRILELLQEADSLVRAEGWVLED
ncbi:hypothetical protein QBC34DRAFT_423934 [Podospora aff. communis PSN243]|uniref:Uncharacterized protein n=1 Tax=Podospora aff. communis PSN243 TaxID=3040156 RepID=A0AAV9GTA2_9PEZI|nr:hypothetical protein QBC34DRAFT_423934 [Podospora aff. communis PSN243]